MKHAFSIWGVILLYIFLLPLPALAGRRLSVPKEYPTIQEALEAARAGDEIHLSPGVYTEHITLKSHVSIYGADPKTTTISGAPQNSAPVVVVEDGAILSGVTITGGNNKIKAAVLVWGAAARISHNIIKNNKRAAIKVEGQKASPTIEYNQIYHNGQTGCAAVELVGGVSIIANNKIYSNDGSGISSLKSAVKIEKNHIFGNRESGILVAEPPATEDESPLGKNWSYPQAIINNNLIENNLGPALLCQNASPYIVENTISGPAPNPLILLFSSGARIKRNKLISAGPPAINITSGNPLIVENTIKG